MNIVALPAGAMTLDQIAHFFNVCGFAVVLSVSAAVLPSFASVSYRSWLGAYTFGFLFLLEETAATFLGRLPLLSLSGLACVMAMVWYLTQTRRQIRGQVAMPRRIFVAVFVPLLGVIAFLLYRGEFNLAAIVPALALSISYVWLGATLLRHLKGSGPRTVSWLGYPLILTGLLPLAFPFIANTPLSWAGYFTGGLLNLLTGISMLVFLLQETAVQLRQKNAELMRLDELRANFISTMSHEFRTPLTVIKSATWLLGRVPEEQGELIATVSSNVDHLDRLVNDVLDFSQMEAGLMRYRKEPTDLTILVAQAIRAVELSFQQKGVQIVFEPTQEPIAAEVDRNKLELVLRNLLSNALKFTPTGGSVTVTLDRDATRARLRVTDTGIGIAPEHQSAIFGKFFQVDNTSTRRAGGTGLGLAISRAIVEDGHSGTLRVESQLEAGSSFIVEVPVHNQPPNPDE